MKVVPYRRGVIAWLIITASLIVAIVSVGGLTRLTGSGLSMVDWRPLMGVIPPLSVAAWQETFALYQQFPEYQVLRPNMTLAEFQFIFWWEYGHRMLARVIGLVIGIPFLWMMVKREIPGWLRRRAGVFTGLVVLQALMGWYMVKSGLVAEPSVSHFRLAAHLLLAIILLQCVLCTVADLYASAVKKVRLFPWCIGILVAVGIQVIYGAFTAGLKAGYLFATYPKMAGVWLPQAALNQGGIVTNVLYNPVMIQWVHRHAGLVLLLITGVLCLRLWQAQDVAVITKRYASGVIGVMGVQVLLGIATLVFHMPLLLAAAHQLVGVVLVSLVVLLCHSAYYCYEDHR